MKTKQTGFTIVELLIVIVVIGILAAITIVAYNGVQARAHDAAVRSDLNNYAKKAGVFNMDHGKYPFTTTDMASLNVRATQEAYATNYYNLYYCVNPNDRTEFVFAGESTSGKIFYASSRGVGTITGNLNGASTCDVIDVVYPGTDSQLHTGYHHASSSWNAWTE